jgi:hypothetical protein
MTLTDPHRMSDPDGKFNVAHTAQLAALFKVPFEKRSPEWFKNLMQFSMNATMGAGEPQVIRGPDGFPYFRLFIPETGKAVTPFCLGHILDHCCAQGLGVVMFDSETAKDPSYIFTYGLLGCIKAFNRWVFEESVGQGLQSETLEEKRRLLTGIPSDDYFPKFMWPFIGSFMQGVIGVKEPKVGPILDPANTPERSLVVNITRAMVQSDQQLQSIGHALQWFMPPGQVLMFLPEGMDEDWMAPLLAP